MDRGILLAFPGCIPDKDPRKKFKHKFDRWQKIAGKTSNHANLAIRLYWRLRPELAKRFFNRG